MTEELHYKLLDNVLLVGKVQTNFACGYSEDNRLFITSDCGIYVVFIKPRLESDSSHFSFKIECFNVSNYAICENVGIDVNSIINELPRDKIYETVLRTDLSTNLKAAQTPECFCTSALWSPKGLVDSVGCALGVLTNFHCVQIYVRRVNSAKIAEYAMVANVTEKLIEIEKINWTSSRFPGHMIKFNTYIKRIDDVSATAFTWTHMYTVNQRPCCTICVGHMKGLITIYHVEVIDSQETSCKVVYSGKFQTSLGCVSTLFWHQTDQYAGGLFIGDKDGQICVINISQLNEANPVMANEVLFYTEKDKTVEKILVHIFEGYTAIIATKQSYLLIYIMNDSGEVIDHLVYDVQGLYITGLTAYGSQLYVLTFSGVMKLLNLNVTYSKLSIEENILPVKIDCNLYRTHGFFFSANRIVLGVVALPYRFKQMSKLKSFTKIFLYYDCDKDPLKMLMSNESQDLGQYWDCIEVLRVTSIKSQKFPWEGIGPNLNYDILSLYHLKTLKLISKLSETVFYLIPKVATYDIKPYIMMHYLVEIKLILARLKYLLNLRSSGTELSLFQMQSMDIQQFFLKEMVVKDILPKAKVGKCFVDEMYEVLSIVNELEFPDMPQCNWCGEKLLGPTCLPPHADSRCCYTMMQLDLNPGFQCSLCDSLAHRDIVREICPVTCPYCDIPMTKLPEYYGDPLPQAVASPCYSDCLKEVTEEDDEWENDVEYVVLSDDSESDEREQRDFRELYFRFAGLKVEELRAADIVDKEKIKIEEIG